VDAVAVKVGVPVEPTLPNDFNALHLVVGDVGNVPLVFHKVGSVIDEKVKVGKPFVDGEGAKQNNDNLQQEKKFGIFCAHVGSRRLADEILVQKIFF
jgi:hypothetical protein